jgi:exopolyphosphatase/guanosine-5'-triphosphate,3'-diphosphate pyrophosphatase
MAPRDLAGLVADRLGAAVGIAGVQIAGPGFLNISVDALVEERTGVPLHVLTHEEEAYLTLVGVTEGRPVTRETLVIDIGGGSSEFVAVGPRTTARAVGVRVGSNRLTKRVGPADPPTAEDVAQLRDLARDAMGEALDDAPRQLLAVGGTATNLLKVTAAGVTNRRLTRERLAEAVTTLTTEPAASLTEHYAVNPVRARLLTAGAVIVEAVLERYGAHELLVSDAGLREGAVLVVDHVASGWRDRLPELAHGWRV